MAVTKIEREFSFFWFEELIRMIGLTAVIVLVAMTFILAARTSRVNEGSSAAKAIRADFKKLVLKGASTRIIVELENNGANEASMWIDSKFLESLEMERITPAPIRTQFRSGKSGEPGVLFYFPVDPAARFAEIQFLYEPSRLGRNTARVATGESVLLLRQFVYP